MFLETATNESVSAFYLAVGLRVCDRGEAELDSLLLTVCLYFVGTPKRKIMDLTKFKAAVAPAFVTSLASIHLVNLSTATRRKV